MGRKKIFTEDALSGYYFKMVECLRRSEDDYIPSGKMAELTGLNKGQIGKALQWGRRKFDEVTVINGKEYHNIVNPTEYILSSPYGYFLMTNGRAAIAYTAQFTKYWQSMKRSVEPIYSFCIHKWPEEMLSALATDSTPDDDDEMMPWGVFKGIYGGDNA